MPTRNQIKVVKSLNRKKNRQEYGLFVAEGRKIVLEALSSTWECAYLYCLKELEQEEGFEKAEIVSRDIMSRMTHLKSPSEALAVLKIPQNVHLEEEAGCKWLVLDGISDPGNMGTLLRIADWFQWEGILCSESCVDLFNPKVVQSSMGSILRVKTEYVDLADRMSNSGLDFLGATMEGKSIWDFGSDFSKSLGLVIGSEAHGISNEVLKHCNMLISIPGGGAESLNAGVAAGILVAALSR